MQGHARAVQIEADALIYEGAEQQPARQRVVDHDKTYAFSPTDRRELELVARGRPSVSICASSVASLDVRWEIDTESITGGGGVVKV